MKKNLLLFVFLAFLLISSCESDGCRGNIVCTEQFTSIMLSLKDQNGNPVGLDSSYVTHIESGSIFTYEMSDNSPSEGLYTVVTDSEIDEVEKDGSALTFSGFMGGTEIVTEDYTIGHDCCHIELLAGKTEVTIQ